MGLCVKSNLYVSIFLLNYFRFINEIPNLGGEKASARQCNACLILLFQLQIPNIGVSATWVFGVIAPFLFFSPRTFLGFCHSKSPFSISYGFWMLFSSHFSLSLTSSNFPQLSFCFSFLGFECLVKWPIHLGSLQHQFRV